jgi:hypothetical protein
VSIELERLVGGLTPADGADPRTFPTIWNQAADLIEDAAEDADEAKTIAAGLDGRVTAVETAVDERAPLLAAENVQTANYTLALTDLQKVVAFDSTSNLTLTVPANATVEFPVGTMVNVYRAGTGDVDIVGASGVTVRNVGSISDQFGEVSLRKRDTDEWVLVGQVDEP